MLLFILAEAVTKTDNDVRTAIISGLIMLFGIVIKSVFDYMTKKKELKEKAEKDKNELKDKNKNKEEEFWGGAQKASIETFTQLIASSHTEVETLRLNSKDYLIRIQNLEKRINIVTSSYYQLFVYCGQFQTTIRQLQQRIKKLDPNDTEVDIKDLDIDLSKFSLENLIVTTEN